VLMPGRRRVLATLVKVDTVNDLALLKIAAITPFVYLSHSQGVPPGMDVVTMGYPHVGIQGLAPKITRGIVNSSSGLRDDPGSFQFSAEVQKGNSGGPLMGPGGTVVGSGALEARCPENVAEHARFVAKRELRHQERALAGVFRTDPRAAHNSPCRP
jgi:S1-C subfamily serine protease